MSGELSLERIAQGITAEWTAEDRLLAIAALLPGLQEDIYERRYSAPGRPNITSLQHILGEPASVLEEQQVRKSLESLVRKLMR